MGGNAFLSFGAVIERFASMYESFNSLDNVLGQHFVEWFSGKQLSGVWAQRNQAGTGTFTMSDEIDGGFSITSSASTGDSSYIDFNDKRHYSNTASNLISVAKLTSNTSANLMVGFMGDRATFEGGREFAIFGNNTDVSTTKFVLSTSSDSNGISNTTSLDLDTNFHNFQLIMNGSAVEAYIDGVLEINNSTHTPTVRLQPIVRARTRTTAGKEIRVRYMEVFNNTVPVNSSLYERLSALTQVMNQRVVETFSGSDIDTDRWHKIDDSPAGTFQMVDEIDEGFEIVNTDGSSGLNYLLTFNNIRQYDNDNSVFITVFRTTDTSNANHTWGFRNQTSDDRAAINIWRGAADIRFTTHDGTTINASSTSVSTSTAWFSGKVDCGSSDATCFINGVLEVTHSTNLPTVKLQPALRNGDATGTGNKVLRCRYFEAYNKLGTETDYPSVYELFNPLTTVSKQHFWDWFSGDSWTNRWTKTDIAGTGSLTIQDALDGGGFVTSGGTTNNETQANFNNKRQFSNSAAELIAIIKATSITSSVSYCGFSGNQATFNGTEKAIAVVDSTNTNIALGTADGSTYSETEGSVAIDTNFHSYKIDNKASSIDLYVDGVLDVNGKGTNLPTAKMQPIVGVKTLTSSAKTTECRFTEAYNT